MSLDILPMLIIMAGRLFTFEGLDGSGISTQATLLRNYLMEKGRNVVLTKEPTNGLIGGLIRAVLRHEWKTDPLTLQMLFATDRAHHLATEIEPALKRGKDVICDRYVLSTLAFGALDVDTTFLKELNRLFRAPDVVLFIDTLPSVCISRMRKARPHVELFEEEHKLEAIRKTYLSLTRYFKNTHIIDGNREPKEVRDDVTKAVKN
mgnify:CR=1 FL=1